MSSPDTITLPGIVDMHVHLREPGAEQKEDFESGTRAAIAGGVAAVMDMPNNLRPIRSLERLGEKILLAEGRVYSDIGFYYGYQPGTGDIGSFKQASRYAVGLKSYLEITTGSDKRTAPSDFREAWREWDKVTTRYQPIVLHSEKETIDEALAIAAGEIGHPTHVAHVSNRAELEAVMDAKAKGWPVTCGATPEHLFLLDSDVHSWRERMKPPLGGQEDQDFLWKNIASIDVIETDHAPHTLEDKAAAEASNPNAAEQNPVKSYGTPTLDALLPVILHAYKQGKLTAFELEQKLCINPRAILGISSDSQIKVSMEEYEFSDSDVKSKCGWSPFAGKLVTGRVVQVVLRGQTVYREGEFASPQGKVIAGGG